MRPPSSHRMFTVSTTGQNFLRISSGIYVTKQICYLLPSITAPRTNDKIRKNENRNDNIIPRRPIHPPTTTNQTAFCLVCMNAVHCVSKKLCKLIFCQNFAKSRPIVKFFWHQDTRENKLFIGVLIFHLT